MRRAGVGLRVLPFSALAIGAPADFSLSTLKIVV